MSVYSNLSDLPPLPIWPGLLARLVEGDRITMAVVELSPGGVVGRHQHMNEQLGLVLAGSVTFRIGDEERALAPGDTYTIRAEVAHEAVAGPDGAVVLDIFSPVREDWRRFEAVAPQKSLWPPQR